MVVAEGEVGLAQAQASSRQHRSAEERGRCRYEAAPYEQRHEHVALRLGAPVAPRDRLAGFGVEGLVPRVDEPDLRAFLQQLHLLLGLVRQPEVVLVDPGDQLAARAVDRVVPATAGAELLVTADEHDPAGILLGVRGDDLGRVVARGVVDHDQLEPLVGLAEDALDRLADERRAVVGRHDRADEWRVRTLTPGRPSAGRARRAATASARPRRGRRRGRPAGARRTRRAPGA